MNRLLWRRGEGGPSAASSSSLKSISCRGVRPRGETPAPESPGTCQCTLDMIVLIFFLPAIPAHSWSNGANLSTHAAARARHGRKAATHGPRLRLHFEKNRGVTVRHLYFLPPAGSSGKLYKHNIEFWLLYISTLCSFVMFEALGCCNITAT